MEQKETTSFGDYIAMARRRRTILLIFCPATMLLAVALALKLPAVYRSTGTIMLESSSVPEDFVRSTVGSYANQQIELLRRRVLTTESLAGLAEEVDPYPGQGLSSNQQARLMLDNIQIERVDPVTLEPLLDSTAFSIHYDNPSPTKAAAVATAVVQMFLTNNVESRTESATETYQFLSEQAARLEHDIGDAEKKLSDFKRQHAGALPENQKLNQDMLERAERDLVTYDGRIRDAEQQQAQLRLQLSQTSPSLVGAAANWQTELASMQAELALARQRYTEDHPDVKRLKRSIEELRQQAQAFESSQASPTPDNPVYMQVSEQLTAINRELAALQSERKKTRTQIDEYSRRLYVTPEIEREYLSLTRGYEIAQEEYRGIKQKLTSADIARSLEAEQRGERFTLIRAPFEPSSPYSPNRLGILLLGFVLASGGGIGLAALAEASDSTIRGSADLRALTGIPAIGAVPFIPNSSDTFKKRLRWTAGIAVFLVALVGTLT